MRYTAVPSCLICISILDVHCVPLRHVNVASEGQRICEIAFTLPLTRAWALGGHVSGGTISKERGMCLRARPSRFKPAIVPFRMVVEDRSEPSDEDDDDLVPEVSSLSFYRSDNGTRDSEFRFSEQKRNPNPYREMMETLTPGEMVGQFMAKAAPQVQGAVKNTIVGLLGSLRASPAFESSISTTHRALASLMFQLEMTGYMFRNAEYRQALQRSLAAAVDPAEEDEEEAAAKQATPIVRGRITVSFDDESEGVEVDAETYVTELSNEVEALKQELESLKQEKEESTARDLLSYVQSMESTEMQSLTSSVSPQHPLPPEVKTLTAEDCPKVLEAMKQLVDTVIKGMGSSEDGLDDMTEVPASTLAQLCMWQLVVGYNLREMEARESMKNRLLGPEGGTDAAGA